MSSTLDEITDAMKANKITEYRPQKNILLEKSKRAWPSAGKLDLNVDSTRMFKL